MSGGLQRISDCEGETEHKRGRGVGDAILSKAQKIESNSAKGKNGRREKYNLVAGGSQ